LRLPAPLARYRPEQPFPSCVPAELESVFPGTYESTTFQRLPPNHWTQVLMPSKIHRPVPKSKDRNLTSPLPLKSKKNPKLCVLKPAIMRFVGLKYDDWQVWTVAQALRDKQTKVVESHLRAQYQPEFSVVVDFTFGVVGTAAIWLTLLYEVDRPITDYLERQSLLASLTFAVEYQVAMALWGISSNLL